MSPVGKVGASAIEDLSNILTSKLGFASKGAQAGIEELLASVGGAALVAQESLVRQSPVLPQPSWSRLR
jgi:hypothetical protein